MFAKLLFTSFCSLGNGRLPAEEQKKSLFAFRDRDQTFVHTHICFTRLCWSVSFLGWKQLWASSSCQPQVMAWKRRRNTQQLAKRKNASSSWRRFVVRRYSSQIPDAINRDCWIPQWSMPACLFHVIQTISLCRSALCLRLPFPVLQYILFVSFLCVDFSVFMDKWQHVQSIDGLQSRTHFKFRRQLRQKKSALKDSQLRLFTRLT